MNNETMRKVNHSLFVLLLVGFFLRVHDLGRQSLWLDEAYTWGVVVNTNWRDVWGAMLAVSDVSPLAYVITKLTAPVLGTSEFGLRLSGAFFGWLAIAATYRAGTAMFGKSVGLLSAGVISFSPFAVWYSQDARPYGLYLFLGAFALWGLHRAERGRGWAVFTLASAAMYVTHYVSALFVYAQAVYILTQLRRQPLLFRRWALAQVVAGIPVGGWVIAFLSQHHLLTANSWIPPVTITTPLQTLWNFVSGDAVRWSSGVAAGVIVVTGGIGWGAYKRWRSEGRSVQLLLWWLALPLTTGWLFSLRLPVYIDRFFEPAILTVALLLAAGVSALPGQWRRTTAVLMMIGLLAGSARLFVDPVYSKEDWRGAAQMLRAEGVTVGLIDAESLLGLTPYMPPDLHFGFARDSAELAERLAEGRFVMVLRSPHESIHALSKSAPFDPLTEGPEFFRQWLAENPSVSVDVHPFTGLALVVINK